MLTGYAKRYNACDLSNTVALIIFIPVSQKFVCAKELVRVEEAKL